MEIREATDEEQHSTEQHSRKLYTKALMKSTTQSKYSQ